MKTSDPIDAIFPALSFRPPSDASAWWAFSGSSLGGLALLHFQAPQRMQEALLLLLSLTCLFLCSDWISSLSGRGSGGQVPPGRPLSLPGLSLSLLALAGLASFCRMQPELEVRFWVAALACGAAFTALMFLLRLELAPYDTRLLALSSLLCTAPALFLAFLAYGPSRDAWLFWLAPALYYPASSVFAWTWLRGLHDSKRRMAMLAAPLMALIIAALNVSADLAAVALIFYLIYLLRRLIARYRQGAGRMPEFSDIRRLGAEQSVWNALILLSWLLSGVAIAK
jgi:hypothetical protein